MAPPKKYRTVNKCPLNLNEVLPDNDVGKSNKSRRKRKFSGLLGSQWSKGELQRFYDAYRKFGKEWKTVAAVVRNRSVEMVEALYNMNRAYLSLPEGTASVVGLIAMMTDHYNVMEDSDSGRENKDKTRSPQKFKKRRRGDTHQKICKEEHPQSHSAASNEGCLSLLKRRQPDSWAVGKRTPRIAVSHSYKRDETEFYPSPSNKGGKLKVNANDDDVTHVAALLTEASLRGSSPQIWKTSYKTKDHVKYSRIQGKERMHAQSKIVKDEPHDASTDDEFREDSLGCKNTKIGDDVRDTVRTRQMGTKCYGKKNIADEISHDDLGDGPEACSGTEGHGLSAAKGIVDIEFSKEKFLLRSLPNQRKRSKNVFKDDSCAFEALQTLADMSLTMPSSTIKIDSSVAVKEDRTAPGITSLVEVEAKTKDPPAADKDSFTENANKGVKRKRKSFVSKASVEEESSKSLHKGKTNRQLSAFVRARLVEHPFSVIGKRTVGTTTSVSIAQVTTNGVSIFPTKQRNRRKNKPQRIWTQTGSKPPEKDLRDHKALHLKEKLFSLSSSLLRSWCAYEWFYSSIDYPWFAKNEFVEYLSHVGLGHIPRLTRVEWSVIRSSLGKPRRFSERFLHEEKDKLKQYRESVRTHYTELRTGVKDGLPTDLARPLTVGQRVMAFHPKTREVHDGSILTVDRDRCRVQFDCLEIGVKFVKDIDIMPSTPLDNMPEAVRRWRATANNLYLESIALKVNGLSNNGRPIAFDPKYLQDGSYITSKDHPITSIMNQMQRGMRNSTTQSKVAGTDVLQVLHGEPGTVTHIQSKKADIQVPSDVDHSRQRKTSTGHYMPPWLKSVHVTSDYVVPPSHVANSTLTSQDRSSNVFEMVRGSRIKAQSMVNAAVQALSSVKEGEDAFSRIAESVYSVQVNGSLGYENHLTTCKSEPLVTGHQSHVKSHNDDADRIELQIPSDLITSCVATLLTTQMCTERQCPPANVAQVIDSLVRSMHPLCPQSLPIYRDIQMLMGKVKTQILALIPT